MDTVCCGRQMEYHRDRLTGRYYWYCPICKRIEYEQYQEDEQQEQQPEQAGGKK